MESMNEAMHEIKGRALFDEVQGVIDVLQSSYREGRAAHQVEEDLWRRVLKLGHHAFGAYLALFGDGDAGERVMREDGREVRRLERLHRRPYQSVFGLFELERAVYGTREGQKIEYVPLDERLQLPQGKHSYLLQDWGQGLSVEMPYARAGATVGRLLGFTQSVHTLERNQREMAVAVSDFWQEQVPPPPVQEGALLVCTADGKGIPIRGLGEKAHQGEAPSSSGMRPGAKKMALIGAVYTVDRYRRTPDEVLEALFRQSPADQSSPARPKPCFKHIRAALQRDGADSTEPQTREIFSWMAREEAQRNPGAKKPVILLMDGQPSQWDAGLEYLPQGAAEVTDILDLLHATGYVWEAAHLFHSKGSHSARAFAKEQIRRMLHGNIRAVIRSLQWQGTRHKLKGKGRTTLERICGYFRNNAHRMAYDVYLEHGFPIASGVIEGACRCVVKDRMERSGMRWVMSGAHAMLQMRCIYLSGLWEEFTEFRIQRESRRLYPGYAANDSAPNLSLAA
jgi:hypothetical protein